MSAQQIQTGTFKENIKMTITTDGRIGIGITNPEDKLHIVGSILLGEEIGTETLSRAIVHNSGTSGHFLLKGRDNDIGSGGSLIFIPGISASDASESSKPHIELKSAVRSMNPNNIRSQTWNLGGSTNAWLTNGQSSPGVGIVTDDSVWIPAYNFPITNYDRIVYLYGSNYASNGCNSYLQIFLAQANFIAPGGQGTTILYLPVHSNSNPSSAVVAGATFIVPAGSTFSINARAINLTNSGLSVGINIYKFGI